MSRHVFNAGVLSPQKLLAKLARGATLSGWPVAVICGIGLLVSIGSIGTMVCCACGLCAGVAEIRRARFLVRDPDPSKHLRLLGRLHGYFTAALGVNVATSVVSMVRSGAEIPGVDRELLDVLREQAPEILEMARSYSLAVLVIGGGITVAWQGWWAYRYFRFAGKLDGYTHVVAIEFVPTPEEQAHIAAYAEALSISSEDVVRDAVRAHLAGTTAERLPVPPPIIE